MPTIIPKTPANGGEDAAKPKKNYRPLFEWAGTDFDGQSGEEATGSCPFCGGPKFNLNVMTGQYVCFHANKCGAKGNAFTLIRRVHEEALAATTDADYRSLGAKRGLPIQTLKRHGLAWHAASAVWLLPAMSEKGEVLNLLRYNPATGTKYALPCMPLRMYGSEQDSGDTSRTLLVCEGPFDAIALDADLRKGKTRNRYDILGMPSATVFYPEWLVRFDGRNVRLLFDNDKAGADGMARIAKMVRESKTRCTLSILKWPPDYPAKCDIGDLIRDGVPVAKFTGDHCEKVSVGESRLVFTRGDAIAEQMVEWLWRGRISFATFTSFAGQGGTQKSTIARDYAARATAGLPMPGEQNGLSPFDVMYFTSEDSASRIRDSVRVHGGDLSRLHVFDLASGVDPIDLLDCLEEIEAQINALGVRLVILDALNSFVGGDISTDAKARRTLSGRLQSLARRTGACIIGIRNWGRSDTGTSSQRSLGATSLSDVARCVLNTRELEKLDPTDETEPRRFQLEFEKVSDAPKPEPMPYAVKNLSTCDADSHLRCIVWGELPTAEKIKTILGKKVAQKGSA